MRRRRLVWAACALALTACNADDPKPPRTPVPPGDLRLLSLDDLPDGYELATAEGPDPVADLPRQAPPDCVQGTPGEQFATTTRVFRRGEALVVQTVVDFRTPKRAHQETREKLPHPGCPSMTARAPGQPDTVSKAADTVEVPKIGDESVATKARDLYAVTFRIDHHVSTVTTVRTNTDLDYAVALAKRAAELLTARSAP